MVSNKSNKKAKKPVQTTLGKAPSNSKEKDTDISHLRKPIETSVCGIKQVLSLLENATNEVKNFVMYECDIMYECRICRSIFRSLANFILHKRNYCREKINPLDYINNNDTYQENVYISEQTPPSMEGKKSINKISEKLQHMDYVREVAKNMLTVDLSSSQKIRDMDDREEKSSNFNQVILEKIDTNGSGVFQTLIDKSNNDCNVLYSNKRKSTKLQVMEIHKIVENDVPVLDPEGKICGFTSSNVHQTSIFPKSELSCTECNHRFASQKSLTNHIKCVHNPSRIIYVCPTCKDTFANPWCVYRHLLKVHRMTNKQVRRLREQVHNSWIRRGEESSIQKKKPPELSQGEANSESQWINDIEGDKDFQMCAGCGKHFERKAALHSHSQMCAKRLEVCNNIKENAKKKEVEEAVEKAKLEKSVNEKPVLTGASKRKGQSVWSYFRKPKGISEMEKVKFGSQGGEDTLNLHNTDVATAKNYDFSNAIPNILTPRPSPSKNENNSSLSTLITSQDQEEYQSCEDLTGRLQHGENIAQKGQNCKDSETVEFGRREENISHTKDVFSNVTLVEHKCATETSEEVLEETSKISALTVDSSNSILLGDTGIIKAEQNEEDNQDINNESNDIENAVFITNTKSKTLPSDKNCCSSLNISLKSTKSDSSVKLMKSSLEDNSRPRSDSFLNKSAVSNVKLEKLFLEDYFQLCTNEFIPEEILVSDPKLEIATSVQDQEENLGAQSKSLTSTTNLVDSSSEENSQSQLNSYFRKSDTIDCQDDNNDSLLQDNHDLLSNEVTFEMFCKKVATVGKTSKSTMVDNKRSPHMLRKRRRLDVSVEKSRKIDTIVLKNIHNEEDDDVIFVGETIGQKSGTSLALETGLNRLSNEETSQVSYSVDLSNLSYNNPLKCKQNDCSNDTLSDTVEETELQRRAMKHKSRGQSVDNKTVSKHEKNEFNFILRAAPYMDRTKLLCIPCGLTFKSFNLLLWHMSAHFSWFRFQCSKCSFITFNKYDCMLHARKQHKLKENNAANFILPLPNWKTVLMSHEFRLLKDCNDLKGKHTDEKIGIDECQDQYVEDSSEIMESDAILFGESSKSSEDTGVVIGKENLKRHNKSGKIVIDIQETIRDFQKLPEPVELAMPADVSEVIRTFSFDESALSPDEAVTTFDTFGDESNDDWGLPKETENGKESKSNIIFKKECNIKQTEKNEKTVNIRPSRIRTKAKQNDDFVYYDNDINNVLNSTEFSKGSPQKQRSDSVLTLKSKGSGKTIPITQKKKV